MTTSIESVFVSPFVNEPWWSARRRPNGLAATHTCHPLNSSFQYWDVVDERDKCVVTGKCWECHAGEGCARGTVVMW